jgi:alkanesulfonate monooxygenase SsuD/methylene tetrahydromethanopterin reductase-like flavin-dependent oxidoreductase (luciferase family)
VALLHLAVALDQPSVADTPSSVELARLAERGGLDFVTLDALTVLSEVALATRRLGLVAAATRTESAPVPAAVAALDRVSRGRAGWRIDVSAGAGGGLSAEGASTVPRPEQGQPVCVVDATDEHARRAAARCADVALVEAVSATHVGAVRAELRSAAAGFGRDPDDLRVLARLTVDLGGGEYAAEPGHGGGGPRLTGRGPLYRGGPVDLAELITAWHTDGAVDGFHLTPAEPHRDLERLVNATVALLQHRGLFRTFYPGSTLREHLGLARPANRYVMTGGAS